MTEFDRVGRKPQPEGGAAEQVREADQSSPAADMASGGAPLAPGAVLALQRSVGNAAVSAAMGVRRNGRSPREVVGRGGGHPLPPGLRSDMESRLGHDFSDVRVHSDAAAGESARTVGAEAYTSGSEVVFGPGRFSPGTDTGRTRLAHELTHVVQQRAGRVSATPVGDGLALSHPGDAFEREAESAARQPHPTLGPAPAAGPAPGGGGATVVQRDLTDQQKGVMEKSGAEAKVRSAAARKALLTKVKSFGMSAKDLDLIKAHIKQAEVTVNFRAYQMIGSKPLPEVMQSSGVVRNMFETGSSGGSSDFAGREKVERDLFGYKEITPTSAMAEKTERPKYAAINPTTSGMGGADTSSYGMSALVLDPKVRSRTTLTPSDSFAAKNPELVGTFDDIDHVLLAKFSEGEGQDFARTLLAHAKGQRADTKGFGYLEAQVHGQIDIARDVLYVRANFNEAFGTPNGDALRALAGIKPVIWSAIGKRDQMVLEPTKGPPKTKFDAIWQEVKNLRETAERDGKPIPTVVANPRLAPFWDKLLAAMPPANLYVSDAKKNNLGQLSGRKPGDPMEPITAAEVKTLLGRT